MCGRRKEIENDKVISLLSMPRELLGIKKSKEIL